jgi:mRNA interferase RelE/StbE
MTVGFRASFEKDLHAITDACLLGRIEKMIATLEAATSLVGLSQLKRLQGHPTFYRIRIGDYRLGLHVQGDLIMAVLRQRVARKMRHWF